MFSGKNVLKVLAVVALSAAAIGTVLPVVFHYYWWDNSGVASWVTGLATLGLALVALWQSSQAQQQIEVSNRNVESAEQQAASAAASVQIALEVQKEAIRARADQFAPRVVVFYEQPDPPRVDGSRSGMPASDGLRLLHYDSFEGSQYARGQEFVFPESSSTFLWFTGRAILKNEGASSARVRLPSESVFVAEKSWLSGDLIGTPALVDKGDPGTAILPPGGQAMFRWAAGHSLGEWAEARQDLGSRSPLGDFWLWVTVFESREIGILDTMLAHFKPDVLVPVPGRDAHWMVRDTLDFGQVNPIPTRRNYVHEGQRFEDLSQRDAYYRGETL